MLKVAFWTPAVFQEVDGVVEYLRRIVIESKHNPGLHGNSMGMDTANDPQILVHAIERLIHFSDAGLGNRLQPQEQLLTSAISRDLQEFVVPAGMDAGLTAPPFSIGSNGATESLRIVHVSDNVIVPEDNYFSSERGVFGSDLGYGTLAQLMTVHHGNRAEIALAGTSAGGEQNTIGVVVSVKQLLAGFGSLVNGWRAALPVHTEIRSRLQSPAGSLPTNLPLLR